MRQNKIGWIEYRLFDLLALLTLLSLAMLLGQAIMAAPMQLPGLSIDRLSAVTTLLVAGVGTVAYHFSLRYLDGEPKQRHFLRWLFLTVGMAYLFMLSTNLLLLFAAWLCTSLGLHRLLTFYGERTEAQRPARKKFLISRLGDLALLGAIGLIWQHWGTLDLRTFLANVNTPVDWPWAPGLVAFLVVTAALTKSAQFPFHSWLPETMEAPTPVSALMHAGIINAGGVLLLRFAPLLVTVPTALFYLVVIGTLTMSLGLLVMWTQTTVKRTLAWSTVSQMGFMMVQIGLAVFPATLLHLLGHGFYKAWSFLRTGEVPAPTPPVLAVSPQQSLRWGLVGIMVAIPALALAALLTGFKPLHSPGELALTAILALGLGQYWIAFSRFPASNVVRSRHLVNAVLSTFALALLATLLYQGAIAFFAPVFGPVPVLRGELAWVTAALPVCALLLLSVVYLWRPVWQSTTWGRAFTIHALHGFYIGIMADRVVTALWPRSSSQLHALSFQPQKTIQPKHPMQNREVEYA